jgi:hypothetical protein
MHPAAAAQLLVLGSVGQSQVDSSVRAGAPLFSTFKFGQGALGHTALPASRPHNCHCDIAEGLREAQIDVMCSWMQATSPS